MCLGGGGELGGDRDGDRAGCVLWRGELTVFMCQLPVTLYCFKDASIL